METWKHVWREIQGIIASPALEALRDALRHRDPRLIAGATTRPAPLDCVATWGPEGADPIAYCFWIGEGLETIGEVEEAWFAVCHLVDVSLGEPGGVRGFLHWWDDSPEEVRRAELLLMIERELLERKAVAA